MIDICLSIFLKMDLCLCLYVPMDIMSNYRIYGKRESVRKVEEKEQWQTDRHPETDVKWLAWGEPVIDRHKKCNW